MDSERFGRALGIGARSAAKALAAAMDAATAPSRNTRPHPSVANTSPTAHQRSSQTSPPSGPIAAAARTAARATFQTTKQARTTHEGVLRGGKRFGEAVFGPIARLSGVLWLEITGAFFGIFALFAVQAAWIHRAELAGPATLHRNARTHTAVFAGMALVFGYFCVSSFVRARRRERAR